MPIVLIVAIGIVITAVLIYGMPYASERICTILGMTILMLILSSQVIKEGPEREEVLEKGAKKEVEILYITGNEEPTVHMEDGRSVKINMDNVVLSDDGIDRAIAYDFDWKLPVVGTLNTYSEYILYLTPKTLQNVGITLPSDLILVTGDLVPNEN